MSGEKTADELMTLDEGLKSSILECIDKVLTRNRYSCEGMECISDWFAVLEPSNLIEN